MPFQSEKQRRYLWANEPEIARDWTDTYGSGIAKALGGRIPFYAGSGVASNIDNPANLENQMAKVMQKDIDASKMRGFSEMDYPSYQDQMNLLQGGTEVTPYEFKGLQKGTITEPGTYKPTASLNNLLDNRYVNLPKNMQTTMSDATIVDEIGQGNTGGIVDVEKVREFLENSKNQGMEIINPIQDQDYNFDFLEKEYGDKLSFAEQYNKGTGWLTDARTADEMAQLPMDPLKNKRQKLTDFLSRFIPGATVSKMLRPDANEAYGNVAGLYPEEVWGMQEFGTGEDLRTDPWGKNIVSHAGDYEEGIKDWWEKYGKMEYQTPRMKQKQAWKKRALDKIIKQEQTREATKRATVQQMSERNRIENTGGWQSGMAADPGFMTGPAEGQQLSDVMGSFNRGGLAALWPR